jgi:hypothetical protein
MVRMTQKRATNRGTLPMRPAKGAVAYSRPPSAKKMM